MRTQRTTQLPLLELVDHKPAARASMARRGRLRGALSPEATVRFCNDLLAALDRAEEARQQSLQLGDHRAEHLANLFEAAVRTDDAAAAPRRRQGAA